jgi:hypothetical protein
MTVTLDLPPEKETAFRVQAQARGLSLEQWMLEVADQQVHPVSIAQTDLPILHLGAMGAFHRRDIYDDAC